MGPKPTKYRLKLMGNAEKDVTRKIEIKNNVALQMKV